MSRANRRRRLVHLVVASTNPFLCITRMVDTYESLKAQSTFLHPLPPSSLNFDHFSADHRFTEDAPPAPVRPVRSLSFSPLSLAPSYPLSSFYTVRRRPPKRRGRSPTRPRRIRRSRLAHPSPSVPAADLSLLVLPIQRKRERGKQQNFFFGLPITAAAAASGLELQRFDVCPARGGEEG